MGLLIVDDEEWNVSKLSHLLHMYPGSDSFFDLVSSGEDAIQSLLEKMGERVGYQAIITDFNIGDIDGKQILQILSGRIDEFVSLDDISSLDDIKAIDPELHYYIDVFETLERYKRMVDQNSEIVKIMFSSTLYGDGSNDWRLVGVEAFQKANKSNRYDIELSIIQYLTDARVLAPAGTRRILDSL